MEFPRDHFLGETIDAVDILFLYTLSNTEEGFMLRTYLSKFVVCLLVLIFAGSGLVYGSTLHCIEHVSPIRDASWI
jgi:hypothetical protein